MTKFHNFCLIVMLLVSTSSFGQYPEDYIIENYYKLTTQKFDLKKQAFSKSQFSIVREIILDTNNYFYAYEDDFEELYKSFYFLDMDEDGDFDLLFNGYKSLGDESAYVMLFSNKNGKYIRYLESNGRLLSLKNSKGFLLYRYPCCADIHNMIVSYEIMKDTIAKRVGVTFYNSFLLKANKEYENIMPDKMKSNQTCSISIGTKLYYTPQDTLLRPTYIEKNLIGESESDEVVTVFATHTDLKGRNWLYCKIPSATNTNETKHYILTWIKKENCL